MISYIRNLIVTELQLHSSYFRKVHFKNPGTKRIESWILFDFHLKHSFNGAATEKNGMTVSQRIKHRITMYSSSSILGIYPKALKAGTQILATIFTIANG